MVDSISTNASALKAFSTQASAASQDIANAATTGYVGNRTDFVSNGLQNGGGVTARVRLETEVPGVTAQTRSGTDLAVDGRGFLLVTDDPTSGGSDPILTRAGSFQVDGDGLVRNANGLFLLGFATDADGNATGGLTPVNLAGAGSEGGVEIASDGTVSVQLEDGSLQPVFRVPLGAVTNPNGLDAISRTAFRATADSGDISVGAPGGSNGRILGGALESSNVNLEQELGQLILARQAFAANAAAVAQNSEITDTLFDIVG